MNLLPTSRLRAALLAPALVIAVAGLGASPVFAADQAAAADARLPAPQMVLMRVQVGADGHVRSANLLDPSIVPAIGGAAQAVAKKLTFAPATKEGRPVPSETSLVVTLGFEHQGAGFGIKLLRAQNGPSVVAVGKAQQPKTPKSNGAMVLVGADLRPDGSVDIESFKVERSELRVPSEFDQSQYEKAARLSLKDTRFMLDTVDGIGIPSRISVPFLFNGGAGKPREGEAPAPTPSLTATSRIEGIVLPKIDYTAPAK